MPVRALPLVCALADSAGRPHAAQKLANLFGAQTLIIFLSEHESGRFRPAPGFDQSLPGGQTWRTFLNASRTSRYICGNVAYPNIDTLVRAQALFDHGVLVTFLGESGKIRWAEIEPVLPLLASLLHAESELLQATAREQAAADATQRAHHLAVALDGARADVATTARQLRDLNANLEQRIAEEISRRLQAEAALRHAQKLEAIGQLTGGVAHDFNNLLTVILGGLDSIDRQASSLPNCPEKARILRSQRMAQQGAQRAATLTARLLAFARRQPLDPKPIDVDRTIGGMTELLRSTLGETIRIETVGTAGLWRAFADRPELEHAILNLAVNARDAMQDGGKLTLETGNVWLDETYVRDLPEPVTPGQYVLIAVTDTGQGMDHGTLGRVFEPFFTTKDVGKGTGLGLSQVYGFMRQSGGHIRIYSKIGNGTTVKLFLPRVPAGTDDDVHTKSDLSLSLEGGPETVLVVEDHADLRAYSCEVLRELGYRVLEAETAAQGLAVLRTNTDVHLLFTDVVLPDGIDGGRLAKEARLLRRSLKVLFTTGYARNAIVHNGRLDAGVHLLTKPFTRRALAEKVRQVLDSP